MADWGPKKGHFVPCKTNIRDCHRYNFHPCAGKTMRAEREGFVVVGFACMACIIFLHLFIRFHFFSPNALKRITLGKPSL